MKKVNNIEDYLQAADLGLFTSEMESFCLGILEAMFFACPSVARKIGGIPEVIGDNVTGTLVASEDADVLARTVEKSDSRSGTPDRAGAVPRKQRAREHFSAEVIVPRYEALYRRVCGNWCEVILPTVFFVAQTGQNASNHCMRTFLETAAKPERGQSRLRVPRFRQAGVMADKAVRVLRHRPAEFCRSIFSIGSGSLCVHA